MRNWLVVLLTSAYATKKKPKISFTEITVNNRNKKKKKL